MTMTQSEAKQLLRSEMDKWGLYHWSIDFNNRKSSAGYTHFKTKTIALSNYLIKLSSNEQILDTMRHEIAHAVDFEERGTSDHSWRWQIKARKVGASPTRIVENQEYLKKVKWKYTYKCQGCGIEVGTGRPLKNIERRHCAKCGGSFNVKQNW
jgi:predicted SprT family Zn-dependent metalloprotease